MEQKGKKEGGWGEGIFALLRLELERFHFSLIKRKPKQKIFQFLLKEKNGGQKKIKNVMKNFLFWFAVAKRRQAETHLIILGFVQKKLEFQPKGTASFHFRPKRRERACREATRNAIFALRAKVFSGTEKARGRAGAGSNQSFCSLYRAM